MTNEIASIVCGVSALLARTTEKPVILWASDPIRPGETVILQGHAFSADAVVEASPAPGRPMQTLEILDRGEQCLKALIPDVWAPEVYELRVRTPAGLTDVVRLNRPASLFWVGDQGRRQTPGGRFRVCGRNMTGDPQAARVRCEGARSFDVQVDKAEDYALTAVLPPDAPPGEYGLRVHNGWGGDAGWSDPLPFSVRANAPWPQKTFNVRDYGATGQGEQDDTAAVKSALARAAAAGGGIVFFPRGRYEIRDTITLPRFTVLRGELRERVELLWPELPAPVVLVQGSNSFGVEELTLSCRNYVSGIVSDTGLVPDAGDVFLRRIRMRAMRSLRKPAEEVHARHMDACKRSGDGGVSVLLGGRNIEITDCDIFGSGRALELASVTGSRVTGNTFYNGCQGWYCISSSDGLIFENNDIIGADLQAAGGGMNTFRDWRSCRNIYFARNRIRLVHGGDREGMTTDGGGGSHAGHIEAAEGTRLILSEPRSVLPPAVGTLEYLALWNQAALPGMGVYILKGRGAGQWRQVIRQEGRTVEIDRTWAVAPDVSSLVGISTLQENYLVVGNEISDASIAIQFFGISIGHVMAGNSSSRAGGFHSWGIFYGGLQPSWYCQMLGNEIPEGNSLVGPFNNTPPPRDSHIAAMGGVIPGLEVPMNRCAVIRRNRLHNNARIELIGTVQDAVVERNTVEHSDVGVSVETGVAGALVRSNEFLNVDQPLLRPAAKGE